MTFDIHDVVRRAAPATLALIAAVSLGAAASPQTGCLPEDFSAWAVNRGASAFVLSSAVDIHIARWSTEREKDRFARTLLGHGPGALLQTLREALPVGAIRTPFTADDLLFAWQEPEVDGGRRIILITDRPMVVWKEAMQVQGTEELFTVLEIRLTANDEGEGKAAIGSNIGVDRSLDLIQLQDYGSEPVRLIDVRAKRTTTS